MTQSTLLTDVITVEQLRHMIDTDPATRILDVRTGGEYESAHIPGSYNVPLNTLSEHVGDLADVSHPVVLVCQSGGRATQAHQKLSDAGKATIHILEGGMNSWRAASGEINVTNASRWPMDRQVRLVAGMIALVAVVASTAVPGLQWIAGAVGAGLAFSALTNTCAMATMLAKLPYNRTEGCNISGILDELKAA